MKHNLTKEIDFITRVLTAAGQLALDFHGKTTATTKPEDSNQVLTEADIAIAEYLVGALRTEFVDDNIIDEEMGVIDNHSNRTWVIDPIDGTANFAVGLPDFGIMIGLMVDDIPTAGGIILPAHKRLYLAAKSGGASCNGKTIAVTSEQQLINVLVSYGVDGIKDDPLVNSRQCAVLADLLPMIRNMRNSGCEAVDMMYVAEGRYGGRVNLSAKIWDAVAPQIICEEAGAIWTTAGGNTPDYSRAIARTTENFTSCVAQPKLHRQIQDLIADRL